MNTVTVYRRAGVAADICSHGHEHPVAYLEVKRLTPTGEVRPYDNGYTVESTPLFVDAQGRIYHVQPPVDFGGDVGYVRGPGPEGQRTRRYTSRLPTTARDLFGRPLTDNLSAGPSWSADLQHPRRRH